MTAAWFICTQNMTHLERINSPYLMNLSNRLKSLASQRFSVLFLLLPTPELGRYKWIPGYRNNTLYSQM